jgi:hypothetical protein
VDNQSSSIWNEAQSHRKPSRSKFKNSSLIPIALALSRMTTLAKKAKPANTVLSTTPTAKSMITFLLAPRRTIGTIKLIKIAKLSMLIKIKS